MSLASKRFVLRRDPVALTAWRRFVRRCARAKRPPDGMVEYRGPTELWIPERPRFLYYFTKDSMFRWWFRALAGARPPDIGVIVHGSTPSREAARFVLHTAKSLGVPLVLLGDLDPGDLAACAALVTGGLSLGQQPNAPPNVWYGGLNDVLLRVARRHLGERRFESECLVRMTEDEREQLTLIQGLVPSLASLCGRDSARILTSGLKCEVEAVFGPHVCDGAYLAAVRRDLTLHLPARLGL